MPRRRRMHMSMNLDLRLLPELLPESPGKLPDPPVAAEELPSKLPLPPVCQTGNSTHNDINVSLTQLVLMWTPNITLPDFWGFFLVVFCKIYTRRRNDSSMSLLRLLVRPQDAGTPSNSTRQTCHLGGHPSKY
jgi:hypothetical protein